MGMPILNFDLSRRQVLATGAAAGLLDSLTGSVLADVDKKPKGKDRDCNETAMLEGSDDHLEPTRHIIGTTASCTKEVKERANSVRHVLDLGVRGDAVVGRFTVEDLDQLRRMSDVRYVEPDRTMHALQQSIPWGVTRIGARRAHDHGITGNGANVSVIDTGVDPQHPDLQTNLGTGNAIITCSGDCAQPWDDDNGHGTHVSGTVAALDNEIGVVGVSPQTTIHAVKALDDQGGGTVSGIARGITWTADQGYDVANMSLGGPTYSQALADACMYAYQRGVLLIGAAGNDSRGSVRYPAALPTVIAVSSTTQTDELSWFSNIGPEIELAAPGSAIRSTVPGGGYSSFSGTSMAAPHVAGAGALLMARGHSNTEARNRLKETAEDIGLSSEEQGYGLVDADAAVQAVSIGEMGSVIVSQPNRDTWHSVTFEGQYNSPVIIMNPVSANSNAPVHVRIRNVISNGFEFQLEKWRYLDGSHPTERVSYLVLESGTHTLQSDEQIIAGRTTASHEWQTVRFPQSFSTVPVALTQSLTVNERDPIVTRQARPSQLGTSGFRVRVQEEEVGGAHAEETIGWVALETTTGSMDSGIPFEVRRTPSQITDQWHQLSFDSEYSSAPVFVATLQTFMDSDPAELRYRDLTANGVQVRTQEEQSADTETSHSSERVGYFVAQSSGLF